MRREEYELLIAEMLKTNGECEDVKEILIVDGYLAENLDLVSYLRSERERSVFLTDAPLLVIVSMLRSALGTYRISHGDLRQLWELTRSLINNSAAFARVFDLLISFYAEIECEYIACGVVDLSILPTRRPAWWSSKPRLVGKLEKWKKILTLEIDGGANFVVLRNKVEAMLRVLRNLEKKEVKNSPDVFVSASAYSYCCAELLFCRGHFSASIMMLNRSTEFLMTAVAVDVGIVEFGVTGASMKNGDGIGVASMIRELDKSGAVTKKFTDKHIFSAINTSRNQLGYTHGLGSVSEIDARTALDDAMNELKSIDPTLGWLTKVRDVSPVIRFAEDVIEGALDFDKLVQPISGDSFREEISLRRSANEGAIFG